MKTSSTTDIENELPIENNESLLIQTKRGEEYLALPIETGKKLILHCYATGAISRADTMNLLGIDWYGVLIDELKKAKIPLPTVTPEVQQEMVKRASELLKKNRQDLNQDSP